MYRQNLVHSTAWLASGTSLTAWASVTLALPHPRPVAAPKSRFRWKGVGHVVQVGCRGEAPVGGVWERSYPRSRNSLQTLFTDFDAETINIWKFPHKTSCRRVSWGWLGLTSLFHHGGYAIFCGGCVSPQDQALCRQCPQPSRRGGAIVLKVGRQILRAKRADIFLTPTFWPMGNKLLLR